MRDDRPGRGGAAPLTQRERTDAARRLLIGTTIEILADEGSRAATVARIQEVSGMSRGLVGYHFGSKAQLLEEVVHYVRANFLGHTLDLQPVGPRPGLEQIVTQFDQYLARVQRDPRPAKAVLILSVESAHAEAAVRETARRYFAELRDSFADLVRLGVDDGSVRADIDPVAQGALLHGMLRGIMLQYLLDPDSLDLEEVRRSVGHTIRSSLSSAPTPVPSRSAS